VAAVLQKSDSFLDDYDIENNIPLCSLPLESSYTVPEGPREVERGTFVCVPLKLFYYFLIDFLCFIVCYLWPLFIIYLFISCAGPGTDQSPSLKEKAVEACAGKDCKEEERGLSKKWGNK